MSDYKAIYDKVQEQEIRRKVIEQILELFKIEHMAKKDLERVIREML